MLEQGVGAAPLRLGLPPPAGAGDGGGCFAPGARALEHALSDRRGKLFSRCSTHSAVTVGLVAILHVSHVPPSQILDEG